MLMTHCGPAKNSTLRVKAIQTNNTFLDSFIDGKYQTVFKVFKTILHDFKRPK